LILLLTKAINADSEKPTLDQKFNPTDPVAVEIVLHECDYAVEGYMEKWRKEYRDKFEDPKVYDDFVREYQLRARKDVKKIIAEAQRVIAEELQNEEQEDNTDDDGGV
jgi:hypothetical protein